jgi:protein-tyrosine phosphatase
MIDFHSHILPGIDDGSKNTEMSVEMLKKSAGYGIDTMVATPHFYIRHNVPEKFLKNRKNSYQRLMKAIGESLSEDEAALLPKIRLGAEVFYFNGIGRYDELNTLTIENTDYVLLEMPFDKWNARVISEVEAIIYERNLKPIIAHIERYMDANKGTTYIKDLLSLDVIVQMNAEFFNGFFTRKKAVELLRNGVVQLLGSDCHNTDKRAPNLDKAFDIIKKKCGEETLSEIDRLGRSILFDTEQ